MPIVFRAFDIDRPVHIYRRHLPHWRQDGATYFVTFRLADSIPRAVIERWQEQRHGWFLAHGLTDGLSETVWQEHYRTIPEVERRLFERAEARKLFIELDRCHGTCHLRDPGIAANVASTLCHYDEQKLCCGDYVIMPNHVHWLVQPADQEDIENLLQSIKRFTATQINRQAGRDGQFWQKENYDHLVRNAQELDRIRAYIAANPEKAGLSDHAVRLFQAEWIVGPKAGGTL